MGYLILLLVLIVATSYLIQNKLGISSSDVDVMSVGILGFGALESLAKLIMALATGGALAGPLIGLLISGGFTYWLFTRSGL